MAKEFGGTFGCEDCRMDSGDFCAKATCGKFYCHDCANLDVCEECGSSFCSTCTTFKPGKHGTKRCSDCQPWWQVNKPAGAFCRDCGSQRSDARICEECDARICCECWYDGGQSCAQCGLFCCDRCDGSFCYECTDDDCEPTCTACCEDH